MLSTMCVHCRQATDKQLRRDLCPPCYQRHRLAGALPGGAGLVDVARTAAHLAELTAAGISQREVARRTGMDLPTLGKIYRGKRARVNIATEAKILAIAIPDVPDLAAIAWRELCAAGARGDYISPQRKHRATFKAKRKRALREKAKRDRLRKLRQAQHDARVRKLLGPRRSAPVAAGPAVIRTVDLSRVACGGCEHAPCRCPDDHDSDLAWLPALADHDNPAIFAPRHKGIAA